MTFLPDETAVGTVCFMTFNRGHILLKTIKKLLPRLNHHWPVLVVNNGSTRYAQEYSEIEKIAASCEYLNYYRHKKNILFDGNLRSLFELVPTQFFMVVSDEDEPVFDELDGFNSFLRKNRDIGGIRTSLGTVPGANLAHSQAMTLEDKVFEKGSLDGITDFGFAGTYISGQIYNAPLLNKFNIPQRLKKNITANLSYPHLYIHVLAAANTRTMYSSTIACLQGTAQIVRPEEFTDYFGPFSYGSRIDQFVALRNALIEAFKDIQHNNPDGGFDAIEFYKAYSGLCCKYCYLILRPQGRMYQNQMINLDILSRSFIMFCLAAVEGMPLFDRFKEALATELTKTGEHFFKMTTEVDKVHPPMSFLDFSIKSENYDVLGKIKK